MSERLSDFLSSDLPATDEPSVMRLGDFVSTDPVEVSISEGFYDVPVEQREAWKAKGKIGWFEQWERIDKTEMIPFNPEGAIKSVSLLNSVNRLKEDKYQDPAQRDRDVERIDSFLLRMEEERTRGVSVMGQIAQGVSYLPGFMVEFLATGGIAALGKSAVKASINPVMRQVAASGALKFSARTAGGIAGATLRTAAMPHRVAEGFAERQVIANLELTDKGVQIAKEAQESPVKSAFKAFGDVLIENFSEVTGAVISKAGKQIAGKVIPKNLAISMEKVFSKLRPNESAQKLWTQAGYNGFLEEMGEERLGNLLRAVFGVEDFEADNPNSVLDRIISSIPNGEELLVEAGVLAFPGLARLGVSQSVQAYRNMKPKAQEEPQDTTREITQEEVDALLYDPEVQETEAELVPVGAGDVAEITPRESSASEFPERKKVDVAKAAIDALERKEGVSNIEKRLEEIRDAELRAEFARDARNELKPILEKVDRRIKTPKKGEPLFEEYQRIPTRFKNKNGRPLDEVMQEINDAEIGKTFESDGEFVDFLESLDQQLKKIDSVIQGSKSPVLSKSEKSILSQRLKDIEAGTILGIREGRKIGREEVKSAKEILDRRRMFIRSVKEQFNLTDSEISKINKRDIRLMNNYEFKQFLDRLEALAASIAEKRDIKNQILFQIQDKELKKVDNLRKALRLPTLENMTVDQLNQFNQELESTQKGDEFLSTRKLETVKNTELAGIKTVREAKEKLAEKLGVEVSELDNIKVGALDRFRFDTALAEQNPFYKLLVDETNASVLDGEQRFMEMERDVDRLTIAARKSRKQSVKDKVAPTDKLVFEWLEADVEGKARISEEMTDAELDLANYLQAKFAEFRDYLIQHHTLEKYRTNYITHIRRGFLEAWKEDGLLNAMKETFEAYKEDEAVFKILDDDTETILPMEKFFQFAMKRTGDLKPSKNVARAFKSYARAFTKKQSLDKIVPALDIYAYSLSPKNLTPKGLMMNRDLIKFVRQWINNKKGRKMSFNSLIPQGGKIDVGLRLINSFISIIDLGLNIPLNIAISFGEQSVTFVQLGAKKHALGISRIATEKGKRIIKDNESLLGKDVWRDLEDAADSLGDKFSKGLFSVFRMSNRFANEVFLLGSLSEAEWEAGAIDAQRRAEILRERGRYRSVEGAASLVGSTSAGQTLTKYKTWAIPILRTNVNNLMTMISMLKRGEVEAVSKSREFQELFRATMLTTVVLLAGRMLVDDDDDSFLGTVLKKVYRDSLSVLQALDPTVFSSVRLLSFLEDLSVALVQLATLEEYKTKEGYKGVVKLGRTLTPKALRQFEVSGSGSRLSA